MPLKSLGNPDSSFDDLFGRTWKDAAGAAPPGGMDASGGNITVTPGNGYTYHIFTSSGSFVVDALNGQPGNVEYVIVAGGGSGSARHGGGGGAGGLRTNVDGDPLAGSATALTESTYTVSIGAGANPVGPGSPVAVQGNAGTQSYFGDPTGPVGRITSAGGGGATNQLTPGPQCIPVGSGGSGGASHDGTCPRAGNTPPVSPPQGNTGGISGGPSPGGNTTGGAGGNGHPITAFAGSLFPTMPAAWITATGPTGLYAGGGGGGQWGDGPGPAGGGGGGAGGVGQPSQSSPPTYGGAGGPGGGGQGGIGPTGSPTIPGVGAPGTANTGGGGGGGGGENVSGAGGKGIVIIRYQA